MKTISYLIYITLFEMLVIGGCGYVVFFLQRSPWWFVLAILASGSAYSPEQWAALYTNERKKTSTNNGYTQLETDA